MGGGEKQRNCEQGALRKRQEGKVQYLIFRLDLFPDIRRTVCHILAGWIGLGGGVFDRISLHQVDILFAFSDDDTT